MIIVYKGSMVTTPDDMIPIWMVRILLVSFFMKLSNIFKIFSKEEHIFTKRKLIDEIHTSVIAATCF